MILVVVSDNVPKAWIMLKHWASPPPPRWKRWWLWLSSWCTSQFHQWAPWLHTFCRAGKTWCKSLGSLGIDISWNNVKTKKNKWVFIGKLFTVYSKSMESPVLQSQDTQLPAGTWLTSTRYRPCQGKLYAIWNGAVAWMSKKERT